MKWNANNIAVVLQIYRQYPPLWNIMDKDYSSKTLKDDSFKRLMSELDEHQLLGGMDVKQVKSKIKSIKDVYRQELQKIEKSRKSGSGAGEVYTPKLIWFSDAGFLSEIMASRSSTLNLDMSHQSRHSIESIPDDDSERCCEYVSPDTGNNSAGKSIRVCSSTIRGPLEPPKKKLKKHTQPDKPSTQISEAVHQLDTLIKNVTEDKPYDLFGRYVASELRLLQKRSAILLQQDIQNCITRYKLHELEDDPIKHEFSNLPFPCV